ncbi:alpha/beta hydrolase [Variovorax sp. SRS16]|uniref:alpha/beta hydrolase n=1 Tax=Variovorax sp. SRS16 TaxID=282217 RepID=UPI001E56692C|nr:alpha/beta hydrolase fold domain-containing protein [Variovorax sp. SRS16]
MVVLDARWLNAVGASPKQLAGWIGLAGPYDFLPIGQPQAQVAFNWPDTPQSSQPIVHAASGAPRTLLMAATEDTLVDPVRNTRQMADKLRATGVEVALREFDDLGHVTLIGAVRQGRSLESTGSPYCLFSYSREVFPWHSSRCANCSTTPPPTATAFRRSTSTTSNRCRP